MNILVYNYLRAFMLRLGFPNGSTGKEWTCNAGETGDTGFDPWIRKIPWEGGKATNFSILAWRRSWTEEPSGLQSIGFQRVGHDWMNTHIKFRIEFIDIHKTTCWAFGGECIDPFSIMINHFYRFLSAISILRCETHIFRLGFSLNLRTGVPSAELLPMFH